MIARLSGTLGEVTADSAVIDVGGVGYLVHLSGKTLGAIGAEAAGRQDRQWQYLDTFVRNQELAEGRAVDEDILREVAEAVPELDVDRWESDFGDPSSEELVRDDAKLAFDLKLPAEPAVVVDGPAGERQLIETPSRDEIEAAIAQVSGSD